MNKKTGLSYLFILLGLTFFVILLKFNLLSKNEKIAVGII